MTARRGLGILHLLAAAGLLFTYLFQIVDLAIGGSFVPDEYFVYFTNDTTMIAIVVLALTGVSMLRRARDGVWLTAAALAVVPYALVTGLVYNLTLRGMPSEVYLGMPWANEVLHVAMPLFLALDWFVLRLADTGRPALPWRAVLVALIFPVVWLAVTYVRGALTGWYPYPFLEPAAGPAVIGGYIGGIAVFVVLVTALGILLTRRRVRSGSAGTT
jgi:hypothetical protein